MLPELPTLCNVFKNPNVMNLTLILWQSEHILASLSFQIAESMKCCCLGLDLRQCTKLDFKATLCLFHLRCVEISFINLYFYGQQPS